MHGGGDKIKMFTIDNENLIRRNVVGTSFDFRRSLELDQREKERQKIKKKVDMKNYKRGSFVIGKNSKMLNKLNINVAKGVSTQQASNMNVGAMLVTGQETISES